MSVERKYKFSAGELLDRLSIATLKRLHNKELTAQYDKEIEDLLYDLNISLREVGEGGVSTNVHAEFLYHVGLLFQFNANIWYNESNARDGDKSDNQLFKTHVWNGIRRRAMDHISKRLGQKTDPKVNSLSALQLDDEPKW